MVVCSQCGIRNEPADVFCGSCGIFLAWFGESVEDAVQRPAPLAAVRTEEGTRASGVAVTSDAEITVVIPEAGREAAFDEPPDQDPRASGEALKQAEMQARTAEARAREAKVRALEAEARAAEAETRARQAEARAADAAIRTIEAEARAIEAVVKALRTGVSRGDPRMQQPEGPTGAAGEAPPADGRPSRALPLSLRMLSVAAAVALLLLIAAASGTPWLRGG